MILGILDPMHLESSLYPGVTDCLGCFLKAPASPSLQDSTLVHLPGLCSSLQPAPSLNQYSHCPYWLHVILLCWFHYSVSSLP